MEKVHFTPALGSKSPPNTRGHWEHLSIHNTHTGFGANSSSFYWPDGKMCIQEWAQASPRAPWLWHVEPPGTSTSPFLPPWRESSASSQPERAHLCSRGWNQQSATWFPQYRVKYTMNMKSNSTKCLRTFCFQGAKNGGFLSPPKMGWIPLKTTTDHQFLYLCFFFLASGLLCNSWRIFWPFQKCTQDTRIVLNRFTQTGLLNAQEKGTD